MLEITASFLMYIFFFEVKLVHPNLLMYVSV